MNTLAGDHSNADAVTLFHRSQETNVKGTFITNQAFIQAFGDTGTIINLVSTAVTMAVPGISSYASSKLAVMKLSQALSLGKPALLLPPLSCLSFSRCLSVYPACRNLP